MAEIGSILMSAFEAACSVDSSGGWAQKTWRRKVLGKWIEYSRQSCLRGAFVKLTASVSIF